VVLLYYHTAFSPNRWSSAFTLWSSSLSLYSSQENSSVDPFLTPYSLPPGLLLGVSLHATK